MITIAITLDPSWRSNSPMPADRERFGAKELAISLSHYDLGVITNITEFARGSRRAPKLIITAQKGKYLFKKNCKSCHVEGAEGGVVTPMKKTQAQWERFFGDKSSACATKAGISEKDMNDVQQYLIDHAADSDQPETCG